MSNPRPRVGLKAPQPLLGSASGLRVVYSRCCCHCYLSVGMFAAPEVERWAPVHLPDNASDLRVECRRRRHPQIRGGQPALERPPGNPSGLHEQHTLHQRVVYQCQIDQVG
jgi:hypothetical protein